MLPVFIYCAFVFLLLTIIVIVVGFGNNGRLKVWYLTFFLSLVFGVIGEVLTQGALLYILLLGCLSFFYSQQKKGWQALLLVLVSIPLFLHLPQLGFHNYQFLDHIRITPDAIPYSLYFNYDKTLLPIFVMGFAEVRITKKEWITLLKKVMLYLLLLCPIILGLSWGLHYVRFSPKWPVYTLIWMLVNLFFTCTAEEVLFRQIIQQELERHLQLVYKRYLALLMSAVLFGVLHYAGGNVYMLLATVAGLFYGYIFHVTKEIRSAIFLHFLLNILHFLLFTYPALDQ